MVSDIQRSLVGQITDTPSVKQPVPLRSNDRALKKKSKEFKKEGSLNLSNLDRDAPRQNCSEKDGEQHPVQIGTVRYAQPPETINFAGLWAINPGMAKAHLRSIAPSHKRLDMVAHGFGQWWIGPDLNDFDESLIRACQQRKRKLQQPDSVGDAKTFINNLLKAEDWGNFSLRCEEAKGLSDRLAHTSHAATASTTVAHSSPFAISAQERKESALGLARFKVSRGQIEAAKVISRQFDILLSEIGLANEEQLSSSTLKVA